jgi:NDP-sugar pyrophosphorylase family protein
MQVIILATDEQRKLPPLTERLPAPMLPIVDRPVLATTVEILARAGYKQLLLSLYERGGQIAAYFGGGRRWGVDIKYVTQRQAWGTAGALRWAGGLLGETFLALPGDSLYDLDIEAALNFHYAHGGIATAILHAPRKATSSYTALSSDDGRLVGIAPASAEAEGLQVTGAFIFEPAALRYIPQRDSFDTVAELLPALIEAGEQVYGYTMSGYWNPLDSLAAYQEAQQVYLYSAFAQHSPELVSSGPAERVRYPSLEARNIAPGVWVGRDHSIHPSVKIAAPVYIGNNSWIGREVELGVGTVIGDGVVIDDEATVSGSTILSSTYVGRLVNVEDKVVTADSISDPSASATTRIVDPFLIARVGAAAEGRSPGRRLMSSVATMGLIILLSPFFLLAGLIALVGNGGRILVRYPRVGQRVGSINSSPRTFQLIQFRTRRNNGSFALGGRMLERWELNRLPELLNVLRGDMGLVGVKPLSPEDAAKLTEEWHQRRHEVPAGVTGLWYLQTEPDSDLDTVIVTDVYYTATRNWRGDMLLLLRTPGTWLRRHTGQSERPYLVKADNVGSM